QSLSKSGTAFSEAYAAMRTGKSELQTARTGYTASRAEFERTLALIDKLTAQLQSTIGPPQPQPPQPQPPQPPCQFCVEIRRQHVNPGNQIVVSENTLEGQRVMQVVRNKINNEMSTLERIQVKFALSGANGFTCALVKCNNQRYVFFWWHILDEIMDILPIDK
ncbi:MAG: hypothetical protein PHW04_10370, partial [Candidatus Wallbacteria bacterium]|nr:hypothetical protein [Candidatus Wallbacteria bacterium]